jgi:hypothetical protein
MDNIVFIQYRIRSLMLRRACGAAHIQREGNVLNYSLCLLHKPRLNLIPKLVRQPHVLLSPMSI